MISRRILHCIPGMGGGGAERQLAYLAATLPRFGWDVHVALRRGGPNFERLVRSGATIHHISGLTNHNPEIAWQLFRTMRRVKPDLVQVWLLQMEIAGAAAATLAGIPWILSERSSELAYPRTWKNRLRVVVGSRSAAVAANSPEGARYWAARRRPPRRQAVIPNALPSAEIEATAPADMRMLGIPADSQVILFAGRLSPEKNVTILLRALEVALAAHPRAIAVLAGDGPLRPAVQAFRSRPGMSTRVAKPGYVEHLWPLMKRASVFVSVSHFEGHPNTVLEAAACGAPLVLSDIPSHRAMFNDQSALFAPAGDAGAIAAAIGASLLDAASARDRAARAMASVAGLDTRVIGARYDRLYREVLGARDAAVSEEGRRETT